MKLFELIDQLPSVTEADGPSVMRRWVTQLPIKHQGTLVCAVRGCDTRSKDDPSKPLVRMIRRASLNPYQTDATRAKRGFFGFDPPDLRYGLSELFKLAG
jgi:hypothetical protein